MRVYLDTNILVFLFQKNINEIGPQVQDIINDYANTLLTSTICVQELIHLCQIGKIYGGKKRKEIAEADKIISWLDCMGIEIIQVNTLHLQKYSELPLYDDHRDPADRLIIAQAMADRIALVSSDRKFSRYIKHGLEFIENER